MKQLLELCGDTVDWADQCIQQVESTYHALADGTRYVYDRVSAHEKITEEWIRSELATMASTYQAFATEVWQAIIKQTQVTNQQQICQMTQLAWVNDSLSFLAETNVARSQHLANFQGNVELWASAHQDRVNMLEKQLQEVLLEIQ